MAKRYATMCTAELVDRIRSRERISPTSVIIHFDDCYQDVVLNGAPILKAIGHSAVAFVSSGFVDTERAFKHDSQYHPFKYPNLRTDNIDAWVKSGFEIGSHTVNHPDLGSCSLEEARFEVFESRSQLERVLSGNGPSSCQDNQRVTYLSFPFGGTRNIRSEVLAMAREAGYSAVFSAHGGFVGPNTDVYDIPRLGCSRASRPLQLLLEIEGLAPAQMMSKLQRIGSWCTALISHRKKLRHAFSQTDSK